LGKCYEYNITLHQLFVDFKQVYDSINSEKLILILEEFKIPRKLINLIGMTLRNTTRRIKVQNMMTEEFAINKGLRQGDALSTQLFNVVLEKVMRNIQINKGGSIYTRTLHILAYADDINLIGRSTGRLKDAVVEQKRNVMAHTQKPDLVFQRNGRVHLYRRGCQFSWLLAAEVCASAVIMLDRPCPIQCTTAGYPLHSPFSPSLLHPCISVCHHIPFLLYKWKREPTKWG